MDIPIANIYYLLCYAWDVLEEKDSVVEVEVLESTDLVDLFARVLVNGTRRLLRRGLDRGYVPREDELLGLRGKILLTQTLRRDLLRYGRSACLWDELEYDTPPNRILKSTLLRLQECAELEMRTRADVHDLLRWLAPVKSIPLRGEHFRRVQLHRNSRIYRFLLHVCRFLHEHWLPSEHGSNWRFRDFVRNGLPQLFEKFVFNFYKHELAANWIVSAPVFRWQITNANEHARTYLPHMKTDVCLYGESKAVILDTKCYVRALTESAYGAEKLSSANLYQLFAYLQQRAFEPGWEQAEGVLLYPRNTYDLAVEFTTYSHRIRAMTLDLTLPWQQIHKELLKIVSAETLT